MMTEAEEQEIRETVGRVIRQSRVAAGFSQERLAELLGEQLGEPVWQTTISQWEHGVHLPPDKRRRALESALKLPHGTLTELIQGPSVPASPFEQAAMSVFRQLPYDLQRVALTVMEGMAADSLRGSDGKRSDDQRR